jgi:alpha-mannosidase
VPAEYDWMNQKRSEIDKEIPVNVELTLKKGSKHLEINTIINNTVKDHYLKVCFPTGLEAKKTWSEGSFMVTEFPVASSLNGDLVGNELVRHPAQLWFDLSDGIKGLAVLTDATKDYEIIDNNTMAMGLVRGVRLRIPCDNRLWMEYPGDDSSQSLAEFSYRYALRPHQGLWNEAGLYKEAMLFSAPMHVCQFGKQEGILPDMKSFIKIHGDNLVLSSVKKAEDTAAIIIRLYNPTELDIEGVLEIGFEFKEANLLNLNEEKIGHLEMSNGAVKLIVGHGKIMSIELK